MSHADAWVIAAVATLVWACALIWAFRRTLPYLQFSKLLSIIPTLSTLHGLAAASGLDALLATSHTPASPPPDAPNADFRFGSRPERACVRHAQRLHFLAQLRAVGAVGDGAAGAFPPPFAVFLLVGACAVATGVWLSVCLSVFGIENWSSYVGAFCVLVMLALCALWQWFLERFGAATGDQAITRSIVQFHREIEQELATTSELSRAQSRAAAGARVSVGLLLAPFVYWDERDSMLSALEIEQLRAEFSRLTAPEASMWTTVRAAAARCCGGAAVDAPLPLALPIADFRRYIQRYGAAAYLVSHDRLCDYIYYLCAELEPARGLHESEFLGVCELFLHGSQLERLAFFYAAAQASADKKGGSDVSDTNEDDGNDDAAAWISLDVYERGAAPALAADGHAQDVANSSPPHEAALLDALQGVDAWVRSTSAFVEARTDAPAALAFAEYVVRGTEALAFWRTHAAAAAWWLSDIDENADINTDADAAANTRGNDIMSRSCCSLVPAFVQVPADRFHFVQLYENGKSSSAASEMSVEHTRALLRELCDSDSELVATRVCTAWRALVDSHTYTTPFAAWSAVCSSIFRGTRKQRVAALLVLSAVSAPDAPSPPRQWLDVPIRRADVRAFAALLARELRVPEFDTPLARALIDQLFVDAARVSIPAGTAFQPSCVASGHNDGNGNWRAALARADAPSLHELLHALDDVFDARVRHLRLLDQLVGKHEHSAMPPPPASGAQSSVDSAHALRFPQTRTPFGTRFALLCAITSTELAAFVISYLISTTSRALMETYGVGADALGQLAGLQALGFGLSQIHTPYVISRFGVHKALFLNLGISAVAMALMMISLASRSLWLTAVGLLLWGVGDVYILVAILIAKHFPDSVGLSFSFASSCYMLLGSVASFSFPTIAAWGGLTLLFWAFAASTALSILAAVLVVWLERHVESDLAAQDAVAALAGADAAQHAPFTESPECASSSAFSTLRSASQLVATVVATAPFLDRERAPFVATVRATWHLLKRQPTCFHIFVTQTFFAHAALFPALAYIVRWLVQLDASLTETSASTLSVGLINLLAIFVTPPLGAYFDARGHRLTAFKFCFSLALKGLVLLALGEAHPVVFALLYVGAFCVIKAASVSTLTSVVAPATMPLATALYMCSYGTGIYIGGAVNSALVSATGGLRCVYVFGSAMAAITVALTAWMQSVDRDESRGAMDQRIERKQLHLPAWPAVRKRQ